MYSVENMENLIFLVRSRIAFGCSMTADDIRIFCKQYKIDSSLMFLAVKAVEVLNHA